MTNSEIRKIMLAKRKALDETTLLFNSECVYKRLFEFPAIYESKVVFVYKSFCGEICTDKITDKLISLGKTVVFPLTENDEMFAVRPLSKEVKKDKFGIDIPIDFEKVNDVDLAITPLVACDENRNRIGFGKGFYDRFFASHPCIKIGLCHDFQVMSSLKSEKWDVALDCIITEKRIL